MHAAKRTKDAHEHVVVTEIVHDQRERRPELAALPHEVDVLEQRLEFRMRRKQFAVEQQRQVVDAGRDDLGVFLDTFDVELHSTPLTVVLY